MSHAFMRFLPAECRPVIMRMAAFGKISFFCFFFCRKIGFHESLKPFKGLSFYVRVNLTSSGGTFFSDTGDIKKDWSWQDNKHHIHAPPYQPLSLTISPHLNVHIKSQEDICILFSSHKHSMQLNKKAKLKVSY